MKKVVFVELLYPYGGRRPYLSGSLITAAAQIQVAGYQVRIIDLNIQGLRSERSQELLRQADFVGVSVTGSPYIPSTVQFCRELDQFTRATIMIGGQVIEKLLPQQFGEIFARTNAVQIKSKKDLAETLGVSETTIPDWNKVSIQSVLAGMPKWMRKAYLSYEMALVLSQGCKFPCDFCAAAKSRKEIFKQLDIFESDLKYFAKEAKLLGLQRLEFYTSSLDLFQNSNILVEYLGVLTRVRKDIGVDIRVRCLGCSQSFLRAVKVFPDMTARLKSAGLWSIGFGVDGTSEEVWRQQHKTHNSMPEIFQCLDLCCEAGIRPEILMVMGFPQETTRETLENFRQALKFARRWPESMLRPYLAKPFVPGNKGWNEGSETEVSRVVANPNLLLHLDFSCVGSKLTHPRWKHRWMSNFAYLAIITCLIPFGKCCTFPLFPSGGGGIKGWFAKQINRRMPRDL